MDRVATETNGFKTKAAAFADLALRLPVPAQGLLLIGPCVPNIR